MADKFIDIFRDLFVYVKDLVAILLYHKCFADVCEKKIASLNCGVGGHKLQPCTVFLLTVVKSPNHANRSMSAHTVHSLLVTKEIFD